jgi:Tetratricopeptide repeat
MFIVIGFPSRLFSAPLGATCWNEGAQMSLLAELGGIEERLSFYRHSAPLGLSMPEPIFSKSEGKYEQAELLYGRALSLFKNGLGPKQLKVTTCLRNYAGLLRAMNRPAEALALGARAQRKRSPKTRRSALP